MRKSKIGHVVALCLLAPLIAGLLAGTAEGTPSWSWVPSPFACNQTNNSCGAGTGFQPTVSYWGQDTNAKGNCTNYAAYGLQRNGAIRLNGSGNAITWKARVATQFGSAAVDGQPAIGSIAWWGTSKGPSGHVAYVENVVGSTASSRMTGSVRFDGGESPARAGATLLVAASADGSSVGIRGTNWHGAEADDYASDVRRRHHPDT